MPHKPAPRLQRVVWKVKDADLDADTSTTFNAVVAAAGAAQIEYNDCRCAPCLSARFLSQAGHS